MEANMMPHKPSKVTAAVIMLYVSVGIATTEWLIGLSRAGQSVGLIEFLTLLTLGPVFFWFIYMIGEGKNWARMTVLVTIVPFLPFAILSLARGLGHTPLSISLDVGLIILDAAGLILEIGALIFLFQKDSSDWFKAMKNLQPLPFRADEETTIVSRPGQQDLENLVARIKAELAEGTGKGTLIGTLAKNGWDRQEAAQFVKQIAYELTANPGDVQLVIKRYKKYMLYGGAATMIGVIALSSGVPKLEMWGHYPLFGSIALLWGFVGWVLYRGRLSPDNQYQVNRSITFRPSKGSLQFTKKSMSPVQKLAIVFFAAFGLFILMLAMASLIWKFPK
ncbi:MAG: hypothetical protein ACLP5H_05345 [Desulfomonilaceae bacterium]